MTVTSQGFTLAEWSVQVPVPPGQEKTEAPPAIDPALIGVVSPTATTITPKVTSLAQYELTTFTVTLRDEANNPLPDLELGAYPTDNDENDYSEVFRFQAVNQGNGVWSVSYAPDRPGTFIIVVTANNVHLAQWTVDATAGMVLLSIFSFKLQIVLHFYH